MKFYKELIGAKECADKDRLTELTEFILNDMQKLGICYLSDDFEKVADNHIVELSNRILTNSQLQDDENPFDKEQISPAAWQQAEGLKEGIREYCGTELTGIEEFLTATHFMLNSQQEEI